MFSGIEVLIKEQQLKREVLINEKLQSNDPDILKALFKEDTSKSYSPKLSSGKLSKTSTRSASGKLSPIVVSYASNQIMSYPMPDNNNEDNSKYFKLLKKWSKTSKYQLNKSGANLCITYGVQVLSSLRI